MVTNNKLLYPELSYQIVGILFDVQNSLGRKLQEKYYQRAVEESLKELAIPYRKELKVDIYYIGKKIGHYFLDFLIDSKLVLELKAVPRLSKEDFRQVLTYLRANNIELGLLANFRNERLEVHRILNTRR